MLRWFSVRDWVLRTRPRPPVSSSADHPNTVAAVTSPTTDAACSALTAPPSPCLLRGLADELMPWLVGLVLAAGFWWPLLGGAGFIGGDTYNYFFPLKHFYAQGLQQGQIRFWHPGIGNGVPVLGESQTGVLYPFNLLAYPFLALNVAYNTVFLCHYVLAFVFAYWLARYLRVSRLAAVLAATVFVYGWFPPRACLEWAIVTGSWLPLAVLCTLRWLDEGRRRWPLALALVLTIQLAAGHFQLAFVTVLTVCGTTVLWPQREPTWTVQLKRRLAVPIALALGFALAAPQLLPSWELKGRSQRARVDFAETVAYGRVPPGYLVQWIAPFYVYRNPEQVIESLGGDTNKIEAHLYFGLAPLALVTFLLVSGHLRRRWWWALGLLVIGLTLATGLPFAWLQKVPGFNYFRYPGRYGLMVQLAIALLVAAAADTLFARSPRHRVLTILILLCLTVTDLWWVGRQVQYVEMVNPPVIDSMASSPVLAHLKPADRVMAMDGNTLALSGAACVPPYLGMGPAEYYEVWNRMPDVFHGQTGPEPAAIEVLRRFGVSHLLTEEPLPKGWPVTLLWQGYDPFLHRRWGRAPQEPLHLYRFDDALGRAYLRRDSHQLADGTVRLIELAPHRVIMDCNAPGSCEVVLTDLNYPGWSVTVDGRPAAPKAEEMFRVVQVPAGAHRVVWRYHPDSFYRGCWISLAALMLLVPATCAPDMAFMRPPKGNASRQA